MTDQLTRRGLGGTTAGLVAGAVALLVLLTAGSAQAATVTVAAMNFKYVPASRTISVGDTVRWTFAGETHTVTSGNPGVPDGRFDSGFRQPGETFQVVFDRPGTYPFFCQVHPEDMFGTMTVKAAAGPTPTAASTPRPTPRPTATVTARPTTRPTSTPTPSPTPAPSPTPTPTPAPSAAPSETTQPSASDSATAGASVALLETPAPSSAPASPGPGAVAPTGAIDATPIVVLLVVLLVLVGGGLVVARGRRVP